MARAARSATDAALDDDQPPAVEPALARHEAGALGADHAGEPIDQSAGFDRQREDESHVAHVPAPSAAGSGCGFGLRFVQRVLVAAWVARCRAVISLQRLPQRASYAESGLPHRGPILVGGSGTLLATRRRLAFSSTARGPFSACRPGGG